MNDILEKLADKYSNHTSSLQEYRSVVMDGDVTGMEGNPKGEASKRALPQTWRESETVIALSEFMTIHKQDGFFLHQTREGQPVIHMEPGVSPSDPERWELSAQVMELAQAAFDDLVHLIEIRSLVLTTATEYGANPTTGMYRQVQLICGGSISSGITAVAKEQDLAVVHAALGHERSTSRRESLVNAIEARAKALKN